MGTHTRYMHCLQKITLLAATFAINGFSLALAGSANIPTAIPNAKQNINPALDNEGGLIFSATYSGSLTGKHYLVFRSLAGTPNPEFSVLTNPDAEVLDWRHDGKTSALQYTGRLVAIPLPAGKYEFRRHIVSETSGNTFETGTSQGYEFSVPPGRWVYLGNIHVILKFEASNRILIRTFISNEQFRDLPLFHSRFKNVTPQYVEIDQREIGEIDQRMAPSIDDLSGLLPPPDSRIRQDERTLKQLDELRDLLPK